MNTRNRIVTTFAVRGKEGSFMGRTILVVLFTLAGSSVSVWAHGGGGHSEPSQSGNPATEQREAESRRRSRIEALQEKIDKLEKKLEDPALPAKKRAKLEKKLKNLFDKKDKLLDER